jgi:hypothetical protein
MKTLKIREIMKLMKITDLKINYLMIIMKMKDMILKMRK